MPYTFDAAQFIPTQWDTAEDKARFARKFMDFVRDFDPKKWNKMFYKRLSNTFGHTAHYDMTGFWDTQFSDIHRQVNFLRRTLEYRACGDPAYTYSDVEQAIQKALEASGILTRLQTEEAAEIDAAERAEYARLKAKFEVMA